MRLYLPIFLLVILVQAFAQPHGADSLGLASVLPKNNSFEHLSVKDGLSNNSVNCILQDREGFIWFGTNDGLNKYDGYTFYVLQGDLSDPTRSFQSTQISGLCEDRSNRLWAVTEGGGLHEINKLTGQVTPHPIRTGNASQWNNQHSVYEDRQGILWLGTHGGLARYDPDRHHFILYKSPQLDMPVKTVFEDPQNRFWVATLRGLYLFNRSTGTFELIPTPVAGDIQPTFISFHLDNKQVLWLGTAGHGLFQINLAQQPFRPVPYNPAGKINPYVYLNSIRQDSGGIIWVGTTNGLQRVDPVRQQVFTYHPDPTVPKGVSSNSAQAVYHDRAGTLWVGTDNGIDRQAANNKAFFTYQVILNTSPVNLSENRVYTLLMDNRDRLWFSNQKTVQRLNFRSNVLDELPPEPTSTDSEPRSYIHTIAPNGSMGMWVGTWHVLYYLDYASDRYVAYSSEMPVQFICPDKYNNVWIGGEGGIAFFDAQTHQFTYYKRNQQGVNWLPDKYIYGLLVSQTDDIWVLLYGSGLARFNPKTGKTIRYSAGPKYGLNSNEVKVIYEDKAGIIWIGTHRGGLNRFDPKTERFTTITTKNGLSSNSIAGITADRNGCIWVSTNKGLSRYNPRTKKVHKYRVDDGLPSDVFLDNAVFQKDNRIYLGSLNGIVYFNPDHIRENRRPFPLYITGLKVMDHPVSLVDKEPLVLAHDQNFLSFEFAALTYVLSEQNLYAYQLVGVDKNWVQSDNYRFANYPNLPPGEYTFRVKAANSDGVWSPKQAAFSFVIRPPWWATWWAYGIYALLGFSAILSYLRFYTSRIREQQEVEFNRREARQLKAVDELKTRFFSNITHEFRTPLSLIISPVEKLLHENQLSPSTYRTLQLIQRNADQLLRLINQLLDISKLEANSMSVSLLRGDVNEFTNRIIDAFQQVADAKGVTIAYTSDELAHEYLFDADKWEKILTNLLSNAVKFTGRGGRISATFKLLTVEDEAGDRIQIIIEDTGIGIAAEKLPHIFDRFFQVDDSRTRAYEGTGIGLALVKELVDLLGGDITVESQLNSGTRFRLTLPVQPVSAAQPDTLMVNLPDKRHRLAGQPVEESPALVSNELENDQQKTTILIVEDNAELQEFLVNELGGAYHVLRASNGADGWELAHSELPDIIITDVMMPVMDGFELTARVKGHPDTNHIAVVMLTAKSAQQSRLEGLAFGADDYLVKPFHLDELHLRLRNLLAHQQKLRDFYLGQLTSSNTPILPENIPDSFLQQLYQLLEKNLENASLNVDWLAEQLSMSRKTLYRKTHTLTQLAPNELIRRYRVRRAADLLQAGKNVTETSFLVGFKTPSHFTIVFKEFYQVTPTEFIMSRTSKV